MGQEDLQRGMSLLLVEGIDAYNFFINACAPNAFNTDKRIQVLNFGGIKELTRYLKNLKKRKFFDEVPAIGIIRDAETNAEGAICSIKRSLKINDFSVPPKPYCFVNGNPKVCFGLLPGSKTDGEYDNGALEDLCLQTIENSEKVILNETDEYLTKVNDISQLTHEHKSRLHAYLSAKNKYVGMKIGEAAKAGAWDWNHQALDKLREMMSELEKCACVNI